MNRVCVIGSCNLDLTFSVPRLPTPGETCAGTAFQRGFGGKGANQAVMAARMGSSVTLIGRLGVDAFGQEYRAHLSAVGVDTTFLLADPVRPTGVAAIWVQEDGQNSIVGVPGANAGLTASDVEAAADAIRAADVVLAPLEVPFDAILAGFRLARQAGKMTVLNPSPVWAIPPELWRLSDVCVLNETELRQLSEDPRALAREGELVDHVPPTVIVTLGRVGATITSPDVRELVEAPAVQAVDTTGAGDAFLGTWAACRAEGLGVLESVRWAVRAASLSVTRPGAQASYPTREEVRAG